MSERVRKLPEKRRTAPKIPLIGQLFHTGGLDVVFCCLIMILFAFGITMMYSAGYAYADYGKFSALFKYKHNKKRKSGTRKAVCHHHNITEKQ